jgi:drug/metabolite transporter (DMT)-like permease
MSKGFEYVNASTGSILMLVENIFVIILALIWFGELPTLMSISGGTLILIGSALTITKGKKS